MRIDRLLATLGYGSRSQVRDMLRQGRVRVNGKAVSAADIRVNLGDALYVDSQQADARVTRHVMLNKPCGVLTAARDRKQSTVLDLLPPIYAACGCMPIGRLDKDTEGLLLLTTNGELNHRLLSPARKVWKCYLATVDGPLGPEDCAAFAAGLALSDFTAQPARLEILDAGPAASTAKVWVCEGKFHQVRRMFAARGRTVTALKRLSVGPLALDETLAPGTYRELTEDEVRLLWDAVTGENEHAE